MERVEIWPEELPDGRLLRSISFRFPVFFDGQEISEMRWDEKSTLETVMLFAARPSDKTDTMREACHE